MTDLWVAIIATDRPDALRELCADLLDRAVSAGVRLRLVVHENSVERDNRRQNEATLARMPVPVDLTTSKGGEPIAVSRCRTRDQVADLVQRHGRPRIVWMLDDDLRLTHVRWTGSRVEWVPLYDHFRFLFDLATRRPDIEVLIGDVTGDPPIPAVATLATRLTDLALNLGWLFQRDASSRWDVSDTTLGTLMEPDAYYDLSVERTPAWASPVHWLPRGDATAAGVAAEILNAVSQIPFGIGFTRPILARPKDFETFGQSTRRGGNAVFFDVDACIEHEYPSIATAGVTTRRSDMIGARLLLHRRPRGVWSSRFSVAHARPTVGPWPTREAMNRSLVADTFGALLARHVDAHLSGRAPDDFVRARVERLRQAGAALRQAVLEIEELLPGAPEWVGDVAPIRSLIGWIDDAVPTGQGDLADDLQRALSDVHAHADIAAFAESLTRGVR